MGLVPCAQVMLKRSSRTLNARCVIPGEQTSAYKTLPLQNQKKLAYNSLLLPRLPKLSSQCCSNGPGNLDNLGSSKELQPEFRKTGRSGVKLLRTTRNRIWSYFQTCLVKLNHANLKSEPCMISEFNLFAWNGSSWSKYGCGYQWHCTQERSRKDPKKRNNYPLEKQKVGVKKSVKLETV